MGNKRTVTVTATGVGAAVADLVTVSVGVQVRGSNAREALGRTNDKTQGAIAAFRAGGVEDRDIGTASITIWPEYGNDHRRVEGYQAQNTLSVRLREVGRAGGLLDTVAGIVGDDIVIHGISFSVSEPEAVLERARADAMARARNQAEQLAGAAGALLGEVLVIEEGSGGGASVSPKSGRMMMAAADAMPVEPGERELTVTVRVTYRME